MKDQDMTERFPEMKALKTCASQGRFLRNEQDPPRAEDDIRPENRMGPEGGRAPGDGRGPTWQPAVWFQTTEPGWGKAAAPKTNGLYWGSS